MILLLWFWQSTVSQFSYRTMPYSEFKASLNRHEVVKCVVRDDDIEGEIVAKTPEPVTSTTQESGCGQTGRRRKQTDPVPNRACGRSQIGGSIRGRRRAVSGPTSDWHSPVPQEDPVRNVNDRGSDGLRESYGGIAAVRREGCRHGPSACRSRPLPPPTTAPAPI